MRVMGLDISTSTIGISVLNKSNKIKLEHSEYYKPPKKGSIFERLSETKEYIWSIIEKYNPDEIIIEEFAQFMKGKSGAKTIIPLALFNRTIGLMIYERTGKEPILMNVNTIRKFIKIDSRLSKEDVPAALEKHLNIIFPYVLKKSGKISDHSYDVADSIAAGLAFFKKLEIESK